MWKPIETAPRDGTKIDLLFPYPRGRAINCEWNDELQCWSWREPKWAEGELCPEDDWYYVSYPNLEPTHWQPLPLPPED